VICKTCAAAADQQLGPEHHCDATGGPDSQCDCQHRTDRYRPRPKPKQVSVVVHVHQDPPHIADAIRDLRRYGPGRR